MQITSIDKLKNINIRGGAKIVWPELDAVIKRLGKSDMGEVSEVEIRRVFIGKTWKVAVRKHIRSIGAIYGKKLKVVFDRDDNTCYFYITLE